MKHFTNFKSLLLLHETCDQLKNISNFNKPQFGKKTIPEKYDTKISYQEFLANKFILQFNILKDVQKSKSLKS